VGLKDRLADRKRPGTTYNLRIDDDAAARAELAAAKAAWSAKASSDNIGREAAAQAAVDACYEQIIITALPPVDMEALLAAHPATEDQRAKDKTVFNQDTFVPALLAACIDSDVTEADWRDYTTTGSMTIGEVNALFAVAWEINYRDPSSSIKKG
jgi:hypothetical protein